MTMKVVNIPTSKKPLMTEKELSDFIQGHAVFAKVSFAYYTSLVNEGFEPVQALEIIKAHKFY